MAQTFATTYLTFASKGLREQLSDAIYNISPEDTPITSSIAKERVKGTLFEWQTDTLASAATNDHLEGEDITSFPAATATVRVGNYCQISEKYVLVSGTLEEVEKAGRRSEIDYQTALRGAEIKRDMEFIVTGNYAGDPGGSTTSRKTASLGAWIKTNTDIGAAGGNPTYTAGVPNAARTDGTQRAITETILKNVLQQTWTSGGHPKMVVCGPVNKGKISAFAGIATKNFNLNDGSPRRTMVIGAADVYVGDFSIVEIIPNRFQRERDAWVLDPDFLALKHLRPFRREPLAKTGDASKVMLLVEWGLQVRQEAALGLCADLTTV